jgi:hypothetical protein
MRLIRLDDRAIWITEPSGHPNVYIRVSEISGCPNFLDVKGVASAYVVAPAKV